MPFACDVFRSFLTQAKCATCFLFSYVMQRCILYIPLWALPNPSVENLHGCLLCFAYIYTYRHNTNKYGNIPHCQKHIFSLHKHIVCTLTLSQCHIRSFILSAIILVKCHPTSLHFRNGNTSNQLAKTVLCSKTKFGNFRTPSGTQRSTSNGNVKKSRFYSNLYIVRVPCSYVGWMSR